MHICQLSNENAGCPKGLHHEVWKQKGAILNQTNNSVLADEKEHIYCSDFVFKNVHNACTNFL